MPDKSLCMCMCMSHGYKNPNSPAGRKVIQLEYECYPAMAEKEMHKICSAVRERWTVKAIAIFHRLG